MTKTYSKPLLWGIFAAYSVLTLIGALNHEVWLDEAQAWVILRDAPLSELPQILRAEGHPPLWYVILYPFVKLGFPPEYASLISWAFMAAGAAVLLFKVELNLPLKAVILASSGFLYFNSVMLRVYCVIPLLMFLILWVYPHRREHPVIYGLLIALLANTHIFICGIVGALGIFMLYELFSEWRGSTKKENTGKLFGLGIACIGVLVLVLPLLGSIETNSATRLKMANFGITDIIGMFTDTFNDVFENVIFLPEVSGAVMITLTLIANCGFFVMLILLRHWRRAFAVELGFLGVYYIACGLVWVTLPNRAAFFILSFAFVLCLTQFEKPVFKEYKPSEESSRAGSGLLGFLKKADKNARKICTVIVFCFFAVSVPSGISLYGRDIAGSFCGAKEMAGYISENFDENAVFVQLRAGMPELNFYDPDIRIFAAAAGDIVTYARWEYLYSPALSADDTLDKLSEYDELYIIYYYNMPESLKPENVLYISGGMRECSEKNVIAVCRYDNEDVRRYFDAIEKSNE